MPYLAERAVSAARETRSTDFMRRAYELNGEPLRLLDGGQQWFGRVVSHEYCGTPRDTALVLGATPWLAGLMYRTVERTTAVDVSRAMLRLCAESIRSSRTGNCPRHIALLQGNWLALPPNVRNLDIVAGDNAFSFLRYPEEWDHFLGVINDRMAPGAVLLSRLLAVPAGYRRLRAADIVRATLARPAQVQPSRDRARSPVNFTAVRVALLFAHWDAVDYTIHPEDALDTFEEQRAAFDPLLCDVAHPDENDLLAIEKYRGTGATYFVPPLAEAIAAFERHFHVRAVYFGSYEMSHYFPLIVAVKE